MKGFMKAILVLLILTIMIPVLSLLGGLIAAVIYIAPMVLIPDIILVVLTIIFNKKKD